jgi:hypothetical protein
MATGCHLTQQVITMECAMSHVVIIFGAASCPVSAVFCFPLRRLRLAALIAATPPFTAVTELTNRVEGKQSF